MIFVSIRAEARPDKRDDFLDGIVRYSRQVRDEPGNLDFRPPTRPEPQDSPKARPPGAAVHYRHRQFDAGYETGARAAVRGNRVARPDDLRGA